MAATPVAPVAPSSSRSSPTSIARASLKATAECQLVVVWPPWRWLKSILLLGPFLRLSPTLRAQMIGPLAVAAAECQLFGVWPPGRRLYRPLSSLAFPPHTLQLPDRATSCQEPPPKCQLVGVWPPGRRPLAFSFGPLFSPPTISSSFSTLHILLSLQTPSPPCASVMNRQAEGKLRCCCSLVIPAHCPFNQAQV